MLAALRNHSGRPNARVRMAALVLVLGLILATAPVLLAPLVVGGWHALVGFFPGF